MLERLKLTPEALENSTQQTAAAAAASAAMAADQAAVEAAVAAAEAAFGGMNDDAVQNPLAAVVEQAALDAAAQLAAATVNHLEEETKVATDLLEGELSKIEHV